jgi:hypothetical protein
MRRKENKQMNLKTLADLKRAIRPNVSILVIDHWQKQMIGTTRIPKEIRSGGRPGIQTNGYYFDGPSLNGEIKEMWANTPKAADLMFNPDGTVTYYPGMENSWTLRFNEKTDVR